MPSPLPLQSSPSSLPCNALIVRELYAEQPGNLLMKKTYIDVEEGHGELSRLCRGALAGPPWLCTTIAVPAANEKGNLPIQMPPICHLREEPNVALTHLGNDVCMSGGLRAHPLRQWHEHVKRPQGIPTHLSNGVPCQVASGHTHLGNGMRTSDGLRAHLPR